MLGGEYNIMNKKYNKYDFSKDYGIGWTSNTNKEFYFDLEDYDKIKDYTWREDKSGTTSLLRTRYGEKHISMHQLLGFEYHDHINKNELDNRKANLRPCTHQENCCNRGIRVDNTSGFTGVYKIVGNEKWRAQITVNGKTYYGLSRNTFEEAKEDRLKLEAKYMTKYAPNINLFDEHDITITGEFKVSESKLCQTNTSGCTGVCFAKDKNKWKAEIIINKKSKFLGYFINKEDAIRTRLQEESKCYGEFAPQKHLFEEYGITIQH